MVESVCPSVMKAEDPQGASEILRNNTNKSSGKMLEWQAVVNRSFPFLIFANAVLVNAPRPFMQVPR